jgi:hypothetical protein
VSVRPLICAEVRPFARSTRCTGQTNPLSDGRVYSRSAMSAGCGRRACFIESSAAMSRLHRIGGVVHCARGRARGAGGDDIRIGGRGHDIRLLCCAAPSSFCFVARGLYFQAVLLWRDLGVRSRVRGGRWGVLRALIMSVVCSTSHGARRLVDRGMCADPGSMSVMWCAPVGVRRSGGAVLGYAALSYVPAHGG